MLRLYQVGAVSTWGSQRDAWAGFAVQGLGRLSVPSPIFPTVSPVPARDRARHRTGNHMVSRGRQALSL